MESDPWPDMDLPSLPLLLDSGATQTAIRSTASDRSPLLPLPLHLLPVDPSPLPLLPEPTAERLPLGRMVLGFLSGAALGVNFLGALTVLGVL